MMAGDYPHVKFYLGLLTTLWSSFQLPVWWWLGDLERHISENICKVSWESLLALSLLHGAANGASWWGAGWFMHP